MSWFVDFRLCHMRISDFFRPSPSALIFETVCSWKDAAIPRVLESRRPECTGDLAAPVRSARLGK